MDDSDSQKRMRRVTVCVNVDNADEKALVDVWLEKWSGRFGNEVENHGLRLLCRHVRSVGARGGRRRDAGKTPGMESVE